MSLSGRNKFSFISGGAGASAMSGLTDVELTTPSTGQVLQYNGTSSKWENATLSGFDGTDTVFEIFDNSDTTKRLDFELSGITTGTTRTLTVPNQSGTIMCDEIWTLLSTVTMTVGTSASTIYVADTFTDSTVDYVVFFDNLTCSVSDANVQTTARILSSGVTLTTGVSHARTDSLFQTYSLPGITGTASYTLTNSGSKFLSTTGGFSGWVLVRGSRLDTPVVEIISKLSHTDATNYLINYTHGYVFKTDYSNLTCTGIGIGLYAGLAESNSKFIDGTVKVYTVKNIRKPIREKTLHFLKESTSYYIERN